MDGTGTIRIAVHSQRRLMRETLSAFLAVRPDFDVVGQSTTLDCLMEVCSLRRPHVALVDADTLCPDTVEQLVLLRSTFPSVEVVLAYGQLAPLALEAALRAGITALVPGSHGLATLVRMLQHRTGPMPLPALDGLTLTERELAIVSLLGAGHSTQEIADLLEISHHTVANHKRRAYAKLGVGNQAHAVSRATSLGMLAGRPVTGGRPVGDDDGTPIVLLHGRPGPQLTRVAVAALQCGLPLVVAPRPQRLDQDHWVRWHRGPILAVLVDPGPDAWQIPASVGACTVVLHSTSVDRHGDPGGDPALRDLGRGAGRQATPHPAYVEIAGDVADDLGSVLSLMAKSRVTMRPALADDLAGWASAAGPGPGLPDLTSRERDILSSIAHGHTIRQTARTLGIASKTVENTQARLFRKLGTHNRSETLTIAYQLGLIDPAAMGDHVPA